MAEQIILGNIVTVNERAPRAQAMFVKDGVIAYVGTERMARSLASDDAEVLDYSGKYIYPGVIEPHCHPIGAADRMALQVDLTSGDSLEDYIALMAQNVADCPGKSIYRGAGWEETETAPHAKMLDAICPDAPMLLNSIDGHSIWLNTKAMELFGVGQQMLEEFGPDIVHIDGEGVPSGIISEGPAFGIMNASMAMESTEDLADAFMQWQDFAFAQGITVCQDVMVVGQKYKDVVRLLQAEENWKLRTYCAYYILESDERPAGEIVAAVQEYADGFDCQRYKINGLKVFVDGVVEGHTAWLLDEYDDAPGYTGVKRFCDKEKLSDLVAEAARAGYYVHAHCIGDAAVRNTLDAFELGQLKSGNMDQRNSLAHLQLVHPDDAKRFGELNVGALVAPLWTTAGTSFYHFEEKKVGAQRAWDGYPIKSLVDAGAVIAFHSDFPVSTDLGIARSIYMAERRTAPGKPDDCRRKPEEGIGRYAALRAMTIDAAWMLGAEDILGSLEVGKVANAVVFDFDLLNGSLEGLAGAQLLATIVDGQEVYTA